MQYPYTVCYDNGDPQAEFETIAQCREYIDQQHDGFTYMIWDEVNQIEIK